MAQHQFYHWLHIRSLYESQFADYVASGALLPLDISTHTVTTAEPLAFDSYRVHLTTNTTTVMPHATATTSTSTSYRQLTSDVLCLPPSPPLLALAGFVPPPPFSYEFTYPSHPFSYPPAAVLEALPAAVRDDQGWGTRDGDEAEEEQVSTEEEGDEEADDDDEAAERHNEQRPQLAESSPGTWMSEAAAATTQHLPDKVEEGDEEADADEDDTVNDSDDEWSCSRADGDATEVDQRSSYAPSYAPSYACSDAEDDEEEDDAQEQQHQRAKAVPQVAGVAAADGRRRQVAEERV